MELLSTDKAATSNSRSVRVDGLQGQGWRRDRGQPPPRLDPSPARLRPARPRGSRWHSVRLRYCGFRAYFRDQACPRCGSRDFEEES